MVCVTTSKEACTNRRTRTNEKDGEFLNFIQRTNPCSLIFIFGLGTFLLAFGLVICIYWQDVFMQEIAKKLPLSNSSDSQGTKLWLSQKVPQYLRVYMFNWTNPNETLEGSEIPHFTECGPYVFKARVYKEDVVWNDNYTVSYLQRRRWDFVPEKSNGSLTDQVTSINVVAVALAYQLKNISSNWVVNAINKGISIRGIRLVITESVEKQLFQGYDDGILNVLKMLGSSIGEPTFLKTMSEIQDFVSYAKSFFSSNTDAPTDTLVARIIERLRKLDNIKDKFGWWYQKNLTDTHHFNIHTGENDVNLLGDVHSWDYKDKCRDRQKIHGSMGDLWPMKSANDERILLFVPDMCSSFDLINSGPIEVQGIDGVKFVGTKETMGPPVSRIPGINVDTDMLTGIRNITSIVKAPVFISFPHFYQANEEYRMSISGMNPDKKKHEFWLILQKDAGVVLQGCGRIQVNIMLEPSSEITLASKLPTTLFPTIWFEQTGEIPPEIMVQLKFGLSIVPRIIVITALLCITIAIVLLANGFILVHLLYKPEPQKKLLSYINFLIFKSKKITITVPKSGKHIKL